MIFAEYIGVNQIMGWLLSLFDSLMTAVYPSAFCGGVRSSLGECIANGVASCGKPYKKQVKLMDCILQTHDIVDRCMEMKENADDLQTFREGFSRIVLAVWSQHIDHYALSTNDPNAR